VNDCHPNILAQWLIKFYTVKLLFYFLFSAVCVMILAMKKLIQGIVEFRKNLTEEKRDLFAKLALGQRPDVLFIACSDSRVVPNLFASTNPGDLFVLRNIGNFVPAVDSSMPESGIQAAIEIAVYNLKVSDIIICGHSECFAMQSLTQGTCDCPHLACWLQHGQKALEKVREGVALDPDLAEHNQVSQANVLLQMDHIKSYPSVQSRIADGSLRVHGWWFDIAKADVYCFELSLGRFVLIDDKEAELILSRTTQ
jgi:carbonic anhydrase